MLKPVRQGGGWHSILYTWRVARRVGFLNLWRSMRSKNACKTCALGMGGQKGGMVNEKGAWPEVCKKSLQAMASDMQGAVSPEFFKRHTLAQMQTLSPFELEKMGRLTKPMFLAAGASHYQEISWGLALEKIAIKLRETLPTEAFFYFSGRSSNEAGFLLQLFCRVWGTNHVNNCSFYCHQASGVGLGASLGTGTATVTLDDLEKADLFFLIGGNPSSNHPRMMTSLMHMRQRGGKVVVINPLQEPGLKRFSIPSNAKSLLFGTKIADQYVQPKVGGDMALLYGVAKSLLEMDAVDNEFIRKSTTDWAAFRDLVQLTGWATLERDSGVSREEIENLARLYAKSERTIFGWTMGITHHEHGVANVQTIVNLALMRGMVGKPFAGLLPIRGHSNVQGMGSMAVAPKLKDEVFQKLIEMGIQPPTFKGYDTMACMDAAHRGEMKFAFCLGGNLYGSNPDSTYAREAMAKMDLVVNLNTTLNLGHAHGLGKETLILPVLARDEEKELTTQESMFNYVRISDGGPTRWSGLRSEVEIICEMAHRVLGSMGVIDWQGMQQHRNIRQLISRVIPGYGEAATIDETKREFAIPNRVMHEPKFPTIDGKAHFAHHPLPSISYDESRYLKLISLRSEGQFNTAVYEVEDVYRGQERRDIIMLSPKDIKKFGLRVNQPVRVRGPAGEMGPLLVREFAMTDGAAAIYYPECNVVIGRAVDPLSKTPAFKSNLIEILI